MKLLSVAIPRPIDHLFTYQVPEELSEKIRVGGWVKVPFGRSVTHAFVVEEPTGDSLTRVPQENLKKILDVGKPDEVFAGDVFRLCKWAHQYYFAPLGEVLNSASNFVIPPSKKIKGQCREIDEIKQNPIKKELTLEQTNALEILEKSRVAVVGESQVSLLEGVTGSGKTEVYIEMARRTLAEDRGVIVLVPEIALTPQLHERFEQGLGQTVALWHSALAAGKRRDLSVAIRSGKIRVVVGARSAIFAPVKQLGLLVVDEEHEPTYKQEDRVRYHARDLAVVRGKLTKSTVILGSATPSFETRERAREGRYTTALLNKKISQSGAPKIELIDLTSTPLVDLTQAPLAQESLKAIQDTIDAGQQAMIYLNRRGFAAFLLCSDCGDVQNCEECSISLTVHKQSCKLRCHVCAFEKKIPDFCSKCQGTNLQAMGAGIESLEFDLPRLLNGARIARLDRDQITSAKRLNETLEEFRSGKSNILIGTQMLVKGHDFPGVTLVLVVLADALFRWPDFRAPERAYQVLKQLAGRSGRGELSGRVLVQTYDQDHVVLQVLDGRLSEKSFLEEERDLRKAIGYPPFVRLARLRFESGSREDSIQRSREVAQALSRTLPHKEEAKQLEILGPSEAFLERAKGLYRWDILIKSKDIQLLHKTISFAQNMCNQKKWNFLIDIDPYGV